MDKINVQLTTMVCENVPVLHDTGTFLVIPIIDDGKIVKGYQVCLNKDSRYPTVCKLQNKRLSIRLANFLEKNVKNKKSLLYNNRFYIKTTVKQLLVDWLSDRKLFNAYVGNKQLSEIM